MRLISILNKMFVISIILVIATAFNLTKAQIVTDGLISYWSLDSNTTDISRNTPSCRCSSEAG